MVTAWANYFTFQRGYHQVCGKSGEAWNEHVENEKLNKIEGVNYPSGR